MHGNWYQILNLWQYFKSVFQNISQIFSDKIL